jgi:hypothetical protein
LLVLYRGLCEIAAGGAIIAGGFALNIVTVGGFTIGLGVTTGTGAVLIGHGLATTTYHAQDAKPPMISWRNTNPFEGPVDGKVIVVDPRGNSIPVQEGNWLTGSPDSKWIQERAPDGTQRGKQTGVRLDNGHAPSPLHQDDRSHRPHGHRPGITNEDGTPWLDIH